MQQYQEQAEYLKNELKNYKIMKKWIKEEHSYFDSQIERLNQKIREIDIELSSGNSKGIAYDYIPTTASKNMVLELLARQEEYISRRDGLIELKKEDISGYRNRIAYVEERLSVLDQWEKEFIIDYYCNNKSVVSMEDKYHYSERNLYRYKDSLINKMLSVSAID